MKDLRPRRAPRVAIAVIVLVAALAPIGVDALWMRRTVLDTDAFVAQVGPMVEDPDVQRAVVARLDRALVASDLEDRVADVLPQDLEFLAPPVASAIRSVAHDAAVAVVESERFAEVVRTALQISHERVVAVLTGGGDVVGAEDGRVTLDLTELRDRVVDRVEASRLGAFVELEPGRTVELELASSPALADAQRLVRVLDTLGYVVPGLLLGLSAVAVWLAEDRRRAVMMLGVSVAGAMVVHLAVLAIGRSLYLDAIQETFDVPAAAAVYDLLVLFPRVGTRALLVLALVVWLGAALLGPSLPARRVRAVGGALVDRTGDSAAELGPVATAGTWIDRHRRGVHGTVLALASLVLVSFDRLTPAAVVWTTVVAAAASGTAEVLAAAGRSTSPEAATSDVSDPSSVSARGR